MNDSAKARRATSDASAGLQEEGRRSIVAAAYRRILGRAVDPPGMDAHLVLAQGEDDAIFARAVETALGDSEEARQHHGVPSGSAHVEPDHVTQHRRDIVTAAYLRILGRPVDPTGMANHLGLAQGQDLDAFARAVEASLAQSAEANLHCYPGTELVTDGDVAAFLAKMDNGTDEEVRVLMDNHYLSLKTVETDPYSEAYREEQMRAYRRLSGKAYQVENEGFSFSVEDLKERPFPYLTGSPAVVGDQLMAWGAVIQAMALPPGARVLELGLGWGSLALQLAQMGYRVSGLDMESRYIDLVRHRAGQIGVDIELTQGQFLDVEHMSGGYDAILFFEAFHHCDDHLRLLKAIPRLLNPGGKLVLAGETVDRRLPFPWGLNCSGHAIRAICKFGWLELAFREEYLLETLGRLGWTVTKHDRNISATAIVYVCQRA